MAILYAAIENAQCISDNSKLPWTGVNDVVVFALNPSFDCRFS